MKNIKAFLLFFLSAGMILTSCTKDEDVNTFFQLDTKGSVTLITDESGFFDITNPDASGIAFSVNTKGDPVSNIEIFKSVKGGSEVALTSVSSFPSVVNVSFDEVLAGTGLTVDDMEPGDLATFRTELTSSSGVYPGKSVNFTFSCSSDLGGDYDVEATGTSTDGCCPGSYTVNSVVTLTDNGSGKYTISDWSGGLYVEWYAVYGMTIEEVAGEIEDVCNTITLTGPSAEPYGESLEGSGSYDPATGKITFSFSNGWGDQGSMVMTPK
jgi:hypothetical protein